MLWIAIFIIFLVILGTGRTKAAILTAFGLVVVGALLFGLVV